MDSYGNTHNALNEVIYMNTFINIFIFTIFLIFASKTDCHSQTRSDIYWDEKPSLVFEDFKLSNDSSEGQYSVFGPIIAMSYVDIYVDHDFRCSNMDSICVSVHALFETQRSWISPTGLDSTILVHEQGHFDICEIVARMMRKDFAECSGIDYNFLHSDFTKITSAHYLYLAELQLQYERETVFGNDPENQAFWNKKLQNMLTELSAFSEPTVKVKYVKRQ